MAEEFSAELKQFIGQHIESLGQLEVLLYLREHSDRSLDAREVSNKLGLVSEMSAAILADFVRRGLAASVEGRFQYCVSSPEIDRVIGLLVEMYRDRRLAVTNEIYSKPLEKVKSFAEAFRLRKEQ